MARLPTRIKGQHQRLMTFVGLTNVTPAVVGLTVVGLTVSGLQSG